MNHPVTKLRKIINDIFIAAGAVSSDADTVADVLLAAELRGIPSHGLMRIKDYIGLWKDNRLNMSARPYIVSETLSTALVDGDNGLGMVAAKFAMEKAIQLAENTGSGWVAVRNSNHFGIAGFYSLMAAEKDMLGFAFTNANPLVAPTFSTDRFLGTNPIAFAIPGLKHPPFVADFATTPIARGKLEIMEKVGKKAPEGFLQDKNGNLTNDPSVLRNGGAILPLGGDYEHAGYKGYCLGAMVDILSSVVSGANFGPNVPPQVAYLKPKESYPGSGLGHFFGALKMDGFRPAGEMKSYMDLWIDTFRSANSTNDDKKVLIPGDPERKNTKENLESGIKVIPEIWNEMKEIAASLNVKIED